MSGVRGMIRSYRGFVLLVVAVVSGVLVGDLLLTKGYSRARGLLIYHFNIQPLLHAASGNSTISPVTDLVEDNSSTTTDVLVEGEEELSQTLISRLQEFSERENLTRLMCSDAAKADQECYNPQCPATFNPSPKARLRQVLATRSLVPVTYQRAMTSAARIVTSHKYVFVTAASSNHYYELQAMLRDARVNLFPQLGDDNYTLVIYDLGLTPFERYATERNCNCTVLDFPFDDLPYFVRHLTCYAWKPFAINSLVSKASEYLVWMDTSIRWSPLTVKEVFGRAKARGHQCVPDHGSIAVRTVQSMFHFYKDQPCQYEPFAEILAGAHVFYLDRFSKEVLLAPWLSCALDQQCMCGVDFVDQLNCDNKPPRQLGRCHRFEQSSMGIILSKLLLDQRPVFYMPYGSIKIAKQSSADWFHPTKRAAVSTVVAVIIVIDVLFIVIIRLIRKRDHHSRVNTAHRRHVPNSERHRSVQAEKLAEKRLAENSCRHHGVQNLHVRLVVKVVLLEVTLVPLVLWVLV